MRIEAAKAYIFGLGALALFMLAGWLHLYGFEFSWPAAGVSATLSLVCLLSRRFPLEFGRARVEVVDIAVLTTLVILGPVWAIMVMAPAMIYGNLLRTVFVAAGDFIKLLAAGFAFHLIALPAFYANQFSSQLIYAAMVAGITFYSLDALINSVLMRIKYATPLMETLKESFLPLIPSDIAAVLAALGTAYVMVAFGPAAALVLFAGAAAALVSLHLIHKYHRESEEAKKANADLLASHVAFAAGIVEAIGAKDGYTARLAAASSVFAADVGKEFGMSEEKVEKLRVAALLQDVGMVGVPDEVFMSPAGKLNSVGRMSLERHAAEGERILSLAPGFEEAAKWVRWHHERVDGTGYPDRLKGVWIPLESRILATAETYAAMILETTHAPAPHEARMELTTLSEKSLDPEAVRAFLRVLDREDENYATAADGRFAFTAPATDGKDAAPPSLRIV